MDDCEVMLIRGLSSRGSDGATRGRVHAQRQAFVSHGAQF
jgi:hypothetical protein